MVGMNLIIECYLQMLLSSQEHWSKYRRLQSTFLNFFVCFLIASEFTRFSTY